MFGFVNFVEGLCYSYAIQMISNNKLFGYFKCIYPNTVEEREQNSYQKLKGKPSK